MNDENIYIDTQNPLKSKFFKLYAVSAMILLNGFYHSLFEYF